MSKDLPEDLKKQLIPADQDENEVVYSSDPELKEEARFTEGEGPLDLDEFRKDLGLPVDEENRPVAVDDNPYIREDNNR